MLLANFHHMNENRSRSREWCAKRTLVRRSRALGSLGLSSVFNPHWAANPSSMGTPVFWPKSPSVNANLSWIYVHIKISLIIQRPHTHFPLPLKQQEGKKSLSMFPGLLRHLASLSLEKPTGVPRVVSNCNLALHPGAEQCHPAENEDCGRR